MAFINSFGIVAFVIILCAAFCGGKNLYENIETSGSDVSGLVEVKRPSFYAGSRYGRSQYGSGTSNNLRVTPRRDFHFLRYGKRANDHNESKATIQCYENVRDYVLTCSFTGVQDYYRCWKGQENKFDALDLITPNAEDKIIQQMK